MMGHPLRALDRTRQAAATFHRLGAEAREATALINAASYELILGRANDAAVSALSGLDLAEAQDSPQLVITALQRLAAIADAVGECGRAAQLLGDVDAWCALTGYERDLPDRLERDRLAEHLAAALAPYDLAAYVGAGSRLSEREAIRVATARPPAKR